MGRERMGKITHPRIQLSFRRYAMKGPLVPSYGQRANTTDSSEIGESENMTKESSSTENPTVPSKRSRFEPRIS
jgi:hypothetical protein